MKTYLLSAYACEPNKGSEPGVGWNWALELAKTDRVIVITRSNNKHVIEMFAVENPNVKLPEFHYCDIPKQISFWKKRQQGLYLYYVIWQILCYRLATEIVKKEKVDIAMSITFGNMWLPTFMYKLPCDFVWGPIGGGECVPRVFWKRMGWKQGVYERIRKINMYFPATNPWFYTACKKAKLIIVRTKDSLACIPSRFQEKCIINIETGISDNDINMFQQYSNNAEPSTDTTKCDFVICGRLIKLKMVDLAIEAYARIHNKDGVGKLYILGSGKEEARLAKLISMYKLESCILLQGNVQRRNVLKIMNECGVLVMSSAKEGGTWVMFEAMLLKKPIVCFNTSGMAEVETSETGILVPISSYWDSVDQFSQAMLSLAQDIALREKLGKQAFQLVSHKFHWSNHVKSFQMKINEL